MDGFCLTWPLQMIGRHPGPSVKHDSRQEGRLAKNKSRNLSFYVCMWLKFTQAPPVHKLVHTFYSSELCMNAD